MSDPENTKIDDFQVVRDIEYTAQNKYYQNNKERILKRIKDRNALRKQEKRFYCEKCDKSYTDNRNLQKHLTGNRHKKKGTKRLYNCEACNYSTSYKQNYNTHVRSKKHKIALGIPTD